MVRVECWRPGSGIGRSECVATLTQDGRQQPQIGGHEPQVVDLERVVLSVCTGKAIPGRTTPKSGRGAWPAPTAPRTCSPRSSTTITPVGRRSTSGSLMSNASSSGKKSTRTPRTFRPMEQPVGPNPARLSPNQPASTDRLVTEIPRICRKTARIRRGDVTFHTREVAGSKPAAPIEPTVALDTVDTVAGTPIHQSLGTETGTRA
jgi:hypothetical protein